MAYEKTMSQGLILTGALTAKAGGTLGSATTDVWTMTGRLVIRSVAADPTGTSTAGSRGELVRFNDVLYIKTTADGTDTNWAKVGAQ